MKNVYAVYFSPTGSTGKLVKAAAHAAAETLGAEYKEIDFTLPDARDVDMGFAEGDFVFLGTPTYAGRVPNKIMPFIRDQIKGNGALGAALVTYGNRSYDESLKELAVLMKENGFSVVGGGAFVSEHAFAGKMAAGRPDDTDIAKAAELGKAAAKKVSTEGFGGGKEWTCEPVGPYYVPKKTDGQPAVFLKAKPKTDREKCTHCGICVGRCPMGSIDADDVTQVTGVCIKCQACIKSCVAGAKYFDNEDFLSHRQMLEENFADAEHEVEIYI